MAVVGLAVGVAMLAGRLPLPGDAATYWLNRPGDYAVGVYGYPPLLSQLLVPLHWFDAWQVFIVGWITLCFGALGYVAVGWTPLVLLAGIAGMFMPGPLGEALGGPLGGILMGNVTMLMVAGMVAGMRHPGWWAVPLLTKMTPGVGLWWFAFRGEWRRFAVGAGVTAAVFVVAFVLAPDAWIEFVRFAVANFGVTRNGPPIVGPPLPVRLLAAVALVAWGARTDRAWVLPIAGAMALIGLYGIGSFVAVAVGVLNVSSGAHRRRLPLDLVPPSLRESM